MQDSPTSDLARAGLVVAGKFRLDSCIGQGGMGSVWSATHLGLGNQIAIKLVSREFVRSPEALRRFDAEAKAAARLQSRHVVQVYDNGTLEDGTPYIAMELLSGESLQQRIDRSGPLAIEEAVEILGQCCKALGRAHSVGIIHRDIKPDNIFLSKSPDDDSYVVKVLDFGVAKITMASGAGVADQSATRTGAVLGTPLYMSPEQARGLKNIDHRTDLYSLGIVAYTMITGRIAFYGESFGDILLKICTEPLPTLRITTNVPPGLDVWMQRVCARDPVQRCASAQEFIDSLRAAAGMRAVGSVAASGALSAQLGAPPVVADSDAPWRLPAAPVVQSVAETSVAMSAGVPRAHGKTGIAVAVSVLAGLVVTAGLTLFALSTRHARHAPAADSNTTAAAGPKTTSPPPAASSTGPSSATLAPLAVEQAASAPSAAAHTPAPPSASTSPRRAPPAPGEPHTPAVTRPQAPASPPPSKPPTSVDLGY
ncbi:MAG TPA: protein kinase [Polyangiaceae bacterium]|nr:protein kinase [Polyangiaceae bacterium]